MTQRKLPSTLLLLAIGVLALPFHADSVEPLKMYAEDMVERSDYILVATVTRTYDGQGPAKFADIEPVAQIKGIAPKTFMYKTGISEIDPSCCETGASYLFFLKRASNGSVVTVGGRGGAIKVTGECQSQDQELVSCPAPQAPRITELRSGQVIVELTVKPDGSVARAHVLSASGHPAWKDPVLKAVKQWRYKPAAHGSLKTVPFDMNVGG